MLALSLAACGGKTEPENTTVAPEETTAPVEEIPLVILSGPAGTGKTYMAIAMACNAYKNKEIQKKSKNQKE